MKSLSLNSDIIGTLASGLCAIHCAATPFLFVVQSCSASCCESSPAWWGAIDYFFIGVTFVAVYWSVKNTSKSWMKYAMFASWILLTAIIANEKFELIPIAEAWKYASAAVLIGLHLYNRKYCKCEDDACNTEQTSTLT